MRGVSLVLLATVVGWGCSPAGPADPLSHAFPGFDIPAYTEYSDVCQSWTLNNDEPLLVNQVEMNAGPGWHHSNWYFVPDDHFEGSDGTWDCIDRDFDQVVAAALGGVLFAQSTQATHEVQEFAEHAVIEIPPHSRVIGNVHLLNATSSVMKDSQISLKLTSTAPEEAGPRLKPMSLAYNALAIPPQERSRFQGTCDMAVRNSGEPVDLRIFYVLPHYHDLGEGMRITASGPDGDELLFENHDKIGDPLSEVFDPPLPVQANDITFGCTFNNPRDEVVGEGIGDQEMCIFLAFTDHDYIWAGGVFDGTEMVGYDEEGVAVHEGPCDILKL